MDDRLADTVVLGIAIAAFVVGTAVGLLLAAMLWSARHPSEDPPPGE